MNSKEQNLNCVPFLEIFLAFSLFFTNMACERKATSGEFQTVKIKLPYKADLTRKIGAMSVALPAEKSYCFGVNVKAVDLPETPIVGGICSAAISVFAGFAGEGEEISLDVLKGSARTFELFLYLANPGTICPTLNAEFFANSSSYLNTFLVGKASDVNLTLDEEKVAITLDFRGLNQNLAADLGKTSCEELPVILPRNPASLRGALFSDGSIVESGSDLSLIKFEIIESFFATVENLFSLSSIEAVSHSSVSIQGLLGGGGVTLPPFLHSFTLQPGTNLLFALSDSGDIYIIDNLTGYADQPAICPFQSCQLPLWVQSISAGYDNELYALDHAGQIYSVRATDLSLMTDSVSAAVTQVLYY